MADKRFAKSSSARPGVPSVGSRCGTVGAFPMPHNGGLSSARGAPLSPGGRSVPAPDGMVIRYFDEVQLVPFLVVNPAFDQAPGHPFHWLHDLDACGA